MGSLSLFEDLYKHKLVLLTEKNRSKEIKKKLSPNTI